MRLSFDTGTVKFEEVGYADPALDRCKEKLNDGYQNDGFMTSDSQSRVNSTSVVVHHSPALTVIKTSQNSCLISASEIGFLSRESIYFPSEGATVNKGNLEVSEVGTWS